jgi:hypothetical protein
MDFLSMLKLCESLSVSPIATLRLAQRSHSLDSADFMRGFKEYNGRFLKSNIIEIAVSVKGYGGRNISTVGLFVLLTTLAGLSCIGLSKNDEGLNRSSNFS